MRACDRREIRAELCGDHARAIDDIGQLIGVDGTEAAAKPNRIGRLSLQAASETLHYRRHSAL
jgi:hypothetical protein